MAGRPHRGRMGSRRGPAPRQVALPAASFCLRLNAGARASAVRRRDRPAPARPAASPVPAACPQPKKGGDGVKPRSIGRTGVGQGAAGQHQALGSRIGRADACSHGCVQVGVAGALRQFRARAGHRDDIAHKFAPRCRRGLAAGQQCGGGCQHHRCDLGAATDAASRPRCAVSSSLPLAGSSPKHHGQRLRHQTARRRQHCVVATATRPSKTVPITAAEEDGARWTITPCSVFFVSWKPAASPPPRAISICGPFGGHAHHPGPGGVDGQGGARAHHARHAAHRGLRPLLYLLPARAAGHGADAVGHAPRTRRACRAHNHLAPRVADPPP